MRVRAWTAGELACLLSHYEVWKLIAADSEPFGAVFEDDLHVDPRLALVVNDPTALPGDADIVKLETVATAVRLSHCQKPGPAGTSFALLETLHHGAGAYILSRRTADLLVRSIFNFDLPIDDFIFGFDHPLSRRLRRYQVLPALAVQDIILSPHQRLPQLDSGLEPDRIIARGDNNIEPQASWRQMGSIRALRRLVGRARQFRVRRLQHKWVVPFDAGGRRVSFGLPIETGRETPRRIALPPEADEQGLWHPVDVAIRNKLRPLVPPALLSRYRQWARNRAANS
jgi:glycosyl transferase family 25